MPSPSSPEAIAGKRIPKGDDAEDDPEQKPFVRPSLELNMTGRHCTGYEFSKGAAHSCCIYDKTKEISVSRKDWMQTVWASNGWDGQRPVTRVEIRYICDCIDADLSERELMLQAVMRIK